MFENKLDIESLDFTFENEYACMHTHKEICIYLRAVTAQQVEC